VVARPAVVLGKDVIDRRPLQVGLDARVGGPERRCDVLTQILAKPAIQRDAEAALGPVEDVVGDEV
jgi:hypothetical protein